MRKEKNRLPKILKIIALICVVVLVVEGIYLGFLYGKRKSETVYTDTASSSTFMMGDVFYVVGSSDFKKSRDVSYTGGIQKAKFAKYQADGKLLFERAYTDGYNSIFNDVMKVGEDFIAVGHYEKTEKDRDEKTGPGLIVRYDKNGKVLDKKEISILADTTFTKVKALSDGGYLVFGQSIFENMTLGTDERGGAQMIRFDKDGNEVWRKNYGGSKSAIFYDAVVDEEKNAIYVVGKDAARTGIFMKYTLDGEQQFVKNYSNTDNIGLSSIAKLGNDFVVVGSKRLKEDRDAYETEALLLKYSADGNLLFEKTYQKNEMARFNSVIVKDEQIYVVGHSAILNEEKTTKEKRSFDYAGIYAQFDQDGSIVNSKEYKEKNAATYFSSIQKTTDSFQIVGQSSAKLFKGNQKDMRSLYITIDKKGTLQEQIL